MAERPRLAAALLACVAATQLALAAAPGNPRDLSGVWINDDALDERLKREGRERLNEAELATPKAAERPLTPPYEAIYQARAAEFAKLAPGTGGCQWMGMPGMMNYVYPFEILHTRNRITMLFEFDSQIRRIDLDRRTHPQGDELEPSFNGDSIAHWEGSTLVVDTVGLKTSTNVRGLPHSDALRVVERLRLLDANRLENQITITDAKAYTRPIVWTIVYGRRPDWRLGEYSCVENNRDAPANGAAIGGGAAEGRN